MSRKCSLCITLMIAVALAFPAVASEAQVTVGDFLMRVAAARDLPAADASQALRSLRASGVGVPALDLAAPLTQGAVVRLSGAIGLALRSSSPHSKFSSEQVDRYFVTFSDVVGDGDITPSESGNGEPGPYPRPNENAADPLTKGKGKHKGIPVSPSDPI